MSQISEYKKIVDRFASERINQRIPNGLYEHATVLLQAMFKNAAAEVRIFTGDLDQTVFGNPSLINSAKAFLRNKPYARLRILVQKEQNPEWLTSHPLVKAIQEIDGQKGDFELRFAKGNYSTDDAHHFAVMDNDGYRFELDHEACKAVANFNEPEVAQALLGAFDKAFSCAEEAAIH